MRLTRDLTTFLEGDPDSGHPGLLPYAGGIFAATWPTWRWYIARMSDGSDEPWGILALLTWALLVALSAYKAPVRLAWPAALLALYGLAYPFLPPLGRAALALGSVGALLFRGPARAPWWGLAALSLPVIATLQFYAGYPLRALAAHASVLLLRATGSDVIRDGSVLRWRGETVMVDVPCSGIHMLWCGLYLAFVLAALHRLSARRTAFCATAAVTLVVGANATRAAILFFKEAHIVTWPEWTHAAVGVALFAGAATLLAGVAQRLALRPKPLLAQPALAMPGLPCEEPPRLPTRRPILHVAA